MGEGLIIFLFIIGSVIAILLTALWTGLRAKEKEEEKEQKRQQKIKKEQEEEEAWKRSTKCLICNECSMGKDVCDDCYSRSLTLKKELPYKRISTYDEVNEYKNNLMLKILYPDTLFQKETNSIKLLSIAKILKEKYSVSKAYDTIFNFLKDIKSDGLNVEEIKEKWALNDIQAEVKNTEEKKDYRQLYERPFRCYDGDYVRSKAERDIDNFFFENRIWHIYEKEYTAPSGQKYYPDFYLPDHNLYIEYFGLTSDEYVSKMQEKISMYQMDKDIKFEYLTGEDDTNIVEKLTDICAKHNIK